jgi:hypothetical protein
VDRFQVLNGVKRNAFSTVTEVLAQKHTPLRLAHYDSDLQLLKNFMARVAASGTTELASASASNAVTSSTSAP